MADTNAGDVAFEYFDTMIFGRVRQATEPEKQAIEELVGHCPQALFGALNMRLNAAGMFLVVDVR